ncbi:hypothetical protein AAZX31_09G063600 [Glycine max]
MAFHPHENQIQRQERSFIRRVTRESNAKAREVDYAKCVRDSDCNPYPPYLDCMGASARCYQDTLLLLLGMI